MTKLKRVEHPMTCPAGYSMDLYCDRFSGRYDDGVHTQGEFPHQYQGQSYSDSARRATHHGWILHRDYTATCPKCSGKRKRS